MSLKSLACNERCPVASAEALQHEYHRGILPPAARDSITVYTRQAAANSTTCCRRCSNYVFEYNITGQPCEMVFAAVAGHLQSLDFTEQYKKWHGCAPVELYTAPVVKFVPEVGASMLQ